MSVRETGHKPKARFKNALPVATFASREDAEFMVITVARRQWDDDGEHDYIYSLPEFKRGDVDSVFAVQERIAQIRKGWRAHLKGKRPK